jgi:hypothetical protein
MKRIILSESKLRRLLYEYNQTRFTPTIMDMDKEFKTLNTLMYNDVLPIPKFIPTNDQQQMGEFKCQIYNNGRISNPTISISVYYQYDIQQFDSLMAHEMIHYYLAYIGHDTNCTHNAEWQQMAADFNQDYGLDITETIDTSNYTPNPNNNGNNQPNNSGINPQVWKQLEQIQKALQSAYNKALKEHKTLQSNSQTNQKKMLTASENLIQLCIPICERITACIQQQTLNESLKDVFGLNNLHKNYYQMGNNLLTNFVGTFQKYKHDWDKRLWGDKKKSRYKYIDDNGQLIDNEYTLYQLVFNIYPNVKQQYSKYSTTLSQQVPTSTQIITEIDGLQQLMQQELGQNQQVQNPTNQPQGGNQNSQQPNPQQNGNNQPTP